MVWRKFGQRLPGLRVATAHWVLKNYLLSPGPAPPVEAQICFSELCALQEGLCLLQTAVETDLTAFTPALIARIFNRNL